MDNAPTGMAPAVATTQSYVDWSAVTAGAVAALAVSFVLLTFGAAVGLSAVSPWTSSSATTPGKRLERPEISSTGGDMMDP